MMSDGWQLSELEIIPPQFTVDHVIVADLEPQIAIYRDAEDDKYLGVVLDEDHKFIRRVFVPLVPMTLKAIGIRSTSLRRVIIESRDRIVIDSPVKDGTAHAWTMIGPLPKDVVPEQDSKLPPSLANELLARYASTWELSSEPMVHLAPAAALTLPSKIRKADTPLLRGVGRLATAVGNIFEGMIGGPVYANAKPGSFAFVIDAVDHEKLTVAMNEYRRIMENISDNEAPGSLLRMLTPDVQDRFEDFFDEISEGSTDVLVTSGTEPCFLTPEFVRSHIARRPQPRTKTVQGEDETIRVTCEGRLTGLDPEGTFHFHSLETPPRIYSGIVSQDFRARMQRDKLSFRSGYYDELLFKAVLLVPRKRSKHAVNPKHKTRVQNDVLVDLQEIKSASPSRPDSDKSPPVPKE